LLALTVPDGRGGDEVREILWAAFFAIVFYLVFNYLLGPQLDILQRAKVDMEHKAYQIERMMDRR